MNGTENSNMVKIDAALGEKANSSVAINTTLLASAWVGVDAPYTQTLTISGLTASQNGTISVAHNATAEQREIAREAMLSVNWNNIGRATVDWLGAVPAATVEPARPVRAQRAPRPMASQAEESLNPGDTKMLDDFLGGFAIKETLQHA